MPSCFHACVADELRLLLWLSLFTFWHWQKAVLILLVNLLQMGKIISMAFSHWIDSSFFRNLSSHLCTYPSWYYSFHDQCISDETLMRFIHHSVTEVPLWLHSGVVLGLSLVLGVGFFSYGCLMLIAQSCPEIKQCILPHFPLQGIICTLFLPVYFTLLFKKEI